MNAQNEGKLESHFSKNSTLHLFDSIQLRNTDHFDPGIIALTKSESMVI
jgi:hypothetical protein